MCNERSLTVRNVYNMRLEVVRLPSICRNESEYRSAYKYNLIKREMLALL